MAELTRISQAIGSGDWRINYRNALAWLREKYLLLRNRNVTAENIFNEGRSVRVPFFGRMYFYRYLPKTRAKLNYYDEFPLVVPIQMESNNKFFGMNFHYLPYNFRTRLMDVLMESVNLTRGNFQVEYKDIKDVHRMRFAVPTLHRYDMRQIRSRMIEIPANEWVTALYLPVERFIKADKDEVWQDSREIIRKL